MKLILWLIVQIKPFKYVGDRTLSQSKKWDLIQQRFEQERMKTSLKHVVPTVRTLQRQMASALRKAESRKLASDYKPYAVFEMLHPRLLLADLELAVLELHDLSEAYKSGQMVGPLPPFVLEEADPHSGDVERRRLLAASQILLLLAYLSYLSQVLPELLDTLMIPEEESTAGLLRAMIGENQRFHDGIIHVLRRHATMMDTQLRKLSELLETVEPSEGSSHSDDHMDTEVEGGATEIDNSDKTKKAHAPESQKQRNDPVKQEKVSSLRDVLNW